MSEFPRCPRTHSCRNRTRAHTHRARERGTEKERGSVREREEGLPMAALGQLRMCQLLERARAMGAPQVFSDSLSPSPSLCGVCVCV